MQLSPSKKTKQEGKKKRGFVQCLSPESSVHHVAYVNMIERSELFLWWAPAKLEGYIKNGDPSHSIGGFQRDKSVVQSRQTEVLWWDNVIGDTKRWRSSHLRANRLISGPHLIHIYILSPGPQNPWEDKYRTHPIIQAIDLIYSITIFGRLWWKHGTYVRAKSLV